MSGNAGTGAAPLSPSIASAPAMRDQMVVATVDVVTGKITLVSIGVDDHPLLSVRLPKAVNGDMDTAMEKARRHLTSVARDLMKRFGRDSSWLKQVGMIGPFTYTEAEFSLPSTSQCMAEIENRLKQGASGSSWSLFPSASVGLASNSVPSKRVLDDGEGLSTPQDHINKKPRAAAQPGGGKDSVVKTGEFIPCFDLRRNESTPMEALEKGVIGRGVELPLEQGMEQQIGWDRQCGAKPTSKVLEGKDALSIMEALKAKEADMQSMEQKIRLLEEDLNSKTKQVSVLTQRLADLKKLLGPDRVSEKGAKAGLSSSTEERANGGSATTTTVLDEIHDLRKALEDAREEAEYYENQFTRMALREREASKALRDIEDLLIQEVRLQGPLSRVLEIKSIGEVTNEEVKSVIEMATNAVPSQATITKVVNELDKALRDPKVQPFIREGGRIVCLDRQNPLIINIGRKYGDMCLDLFEERLLKLEDVNGSGRFPVPRLYAEERELTVLESIQRVLEALKSVHKSLMKLKREHAACSMTLSPCTSC